MFEVFQKNNLETTLEYIQSRIKEFELSQTNEEGYKKFREVYNQSKIELDLFVLIAYSFNHQIRFNNSHQFNNPFGKNRSSFNKNMKNNLIQFITQIHNKNIIFNNQSFEDFNFDNLDRDDFVYCDPPYLISTASYNDGKRGFKGWGEKEEVSLLTILNTLNKKDIKFALSNVLIHKGKENKLLKEWIEKHNYEIHYLDKNYSNSNYQTKIRDKNATIEVLVTNYTPVKKENYQASLFD